MAADCQGKDGRETGAGSGAQAFPQGIRSANKRMDKQENGNSGSAQPLQLG
jgi:hypothetical protein